tara:strand:+ start:471 stop:1157 length:687 start_codon:yes stop_codon:yes gene_type:complete
MKYALIGKGRTGGELKNFLAKDNFIIFDSSNPVTPDAIRDCSVAIAFVPGDVLIDIIPILLEANIPLVSGSTGMTWPADLRKSLEEKNLRWISGSNFSLGMRVVHQMIKKLEKANQIFNNYEYRIHEIHHTQKLDAPSGTAKSWNSWIKNQATITHERKDDVVGDHKITLYTDFENISIHHQALDRKIFAKGAIWAAEYLIDKYDQLPPGLHLFEEITEKLLEEKENK